MDRLLLLLPTRTYRTEAFIDAARTLGVDLVCASERPSTLEPLSPDTLMTVDFADPDAAAHAVASWSATRPLAAVVGVDDMTTAAAAAIAERLKLKSNPLAAVAAARDKFQMRQCLAAAGVPVPRFRRIALDDDLAMAARRIEFPCVVKPLALSASRGVIRADNADQLIAAVTRIGAILGREDVTVSGDAARYVLAEQFVEGLEIALEGLLVRGTLHTLAIFDKPDPLNGPYFEETIYVTPSRLPGAVQERARAACAAACAALGLTEGPVHAELRLNGDGPWVLEVAPRSIGGLCSRTLRFGTGMSLEELILRHALDWPIDTLERERRPAGVMMIPIPRAGRLHAVHGVDAARGVPDVDEISITAHTGQELVPLPEGWQYLGFIFARADTPERVEHALRDAHSRLSFDIA